MDLEGVRRYQLLTVTALRLNVQKLFFASINIKLFSKAQKITISTMNKEENSLLVLFLMVLSDQVKGYTFKVVDFDHDEWSRSTEGSKCPHNQQNVVLCKFKWDNTTQESQACKDPFLHCAGVSVVTSSFPIAVAAIVIVALLNYVYRTSKKLSNQHLRERTSDGQQT